MEFPFYETYLEGEFKTGLKMSMISFEGEYNTGQKTPPVYSIVGVL